MKTTAFFSFVAGMLLFASCGGNAKQNSDSAAVAPVDEAAFAATQPMESGLYDASYYDIQGTNARKGHFDGRVFVSLSPEQSAFYVFENGNRAKIDYKVVLKKPFEKGDSGVYSTVDVKDLPVTLVPDSIGYVLNFEKPNVKVAISIDKNPRSTWSPLETLEKMNEQIKKKK